MMPLDDETQEDQGGGAPDRRWAKWPCCPECQQPRQCVCPICQVSGTDFPLADYQMAPAPLRPVVERKNERTTPPTPAADDPLLCCPTCDESFPPNFYRRCQSCGHDFGGGVEISTGSDSELTPRVLGTAAALVAVVGGIILYFWFLLR